MSVCRRRVCTQDSDGKPYCSERCERIYRPRPRPRTPGDREAVDHAENENRQRILDGVGRYE